MKSNKALVIYDGQCPFCNYWMAIINKIDTKKVLDFSPKHEIFANVELYSKVRDYSNIDSVLLFHNSKIYTKSEAILEIFNLIGFQYKIFLLLKIFPKSFLDYCYDKIGENRYKFFPGSENCST